MTAQTVTTKNPLRADLAENATLRLHAGARGVVVRAERGTVLVTREGDAEDHVLEPGRSLLVTGKGLVVAWALTPAAVRVRPLPAVSPDPENRPAVGGSWRGPSARLGALK